MIWDFIIGLVVSVFFIFCIFGPISRFIATSFLIEHMGRYWKDTSPFSDAWTNELLGKLGLTELRILLFKPKAETLETNRDLAFSLCVPVFVKKSVILLNSDFLKYPQEFTRFVVAHELGHVIDHASFVKIFEQPGYKTRREIDADAFAASVVGRKDVEKGIEYAEKLNENKTKYRDLDIRIMALVMPTIFRQYA